jgi:hypothetical protein
MNHSKSRAEIPLPIKRLPCHPIAAQLHAGINYDLIRVHTSGLQRGHDGVNTG